MDMHDWQAQQFADECERLRQIVGHSPAPWRIAKLDCRVVEDAEGNVVADVHAWREDDPDLIAAAPDLLEALRGMLECMKGCEVFIHSRQKINSQEGPGWIASFTEKAHAAIAKAEGK